MAAFRGAASISELRERFAADEAAAEDETTYEARYGRDKPRFMGSDVRTIRPTAAHLLSPLWRDTEGREYTPDDIDTDGTATVWWVRIPPGLTRRQRKENNPNMTMFPMPGERLEWHRISDADDVVHVGVVDLIEPKMASAQLVIDAAAPARRTDTEEKRMARRETSYEARRVRQLQRDLH